MEQPVVFGLAIIGATLLLFVMLAWATHADLDLRPDSSSTEHPGTHERIERVCPLCGLRTPASQDAGCPLIEAFGVVMAESKRAIGNGPTTS